jgi:ketosteroid isomerase-like protein
MPRWWRRGLVLALLVTVGAASSGCGDLGGDTKPPRRTPIITDRDLDRYPPDSPTRAFLEWFRAMQLRDAAGMARHYLPSLHLTPAELARQRGAAAYALDPQALPLIVEVKEEGDRAGITALFRYGRVWPNGRVDLTVKQVVPFRLRRQGGRWLLADNSFVQLVAREPGNARKPATPTLLVGRRQLARYAPGTPARAFLEWFGALQRSQARRAARYYSPALKLEPREIARQRRLAASAFELLGRPRVVRATVSGDTARLIVRTRSLDGTTPKPGDYTESDPTPFDMTRSDGRWVLTGNGFLQVLARLP